MGIRKEIADEGKSQNFFTNPTIPATSYDSVWIGALC